MLVWLKIVLLAIISFLVLVLLSVTINTLLGTVARCYLINGCPHDPIGSILGLALYILSYLVYFGVFPITALLLKRDFHNAFTEKTYRIIAMLIFSLIPLLLLPLQQYFLFIP